MKSILEFLCFALFTTAISTENSCDPWPSDLKSVWECCDFPTPVASDEESKCDEICGKQTNLEAKKCMVECFSRSTKLLTAEKKINKSEVMIHPSLFPSGHNLAWGPIMVKAIDKCDFEPTDDVNLDLAKFFHCVRAEMIKNCLFFKLLTEGCALVEEHFNKCNDIKPNCSIPAEEIFKADCCVSPELFKADLVDECEHQCKEKEFFRDLKRKCFLDCIINATKVIENGKVDFEVVKSLLVENSNKSDEWEKSIDMSVKNCEIAYKGADLKPRAGTIQFLAHCLPFQMGYNCPESVLKDAAKCRKEKNYREQCEYQSLHVQVFCWKSEILGCFHYAIHNV